MEDGRQSLPTMEPISRPSSTSTQNSTLHHSASLPQLPGLSALASIASSNSPQLRAFNAGTPSLGFSTSSPSATTGGGHNSSLIPTCMNCATSTTPLWRRDEVGSVLCNACGLYLKLHGRPRPVSLKTDVIKSRNRVKTSVAGGHIMKKKSLFDPNGFDQMRSQDGHMGQRRTSGKSANGHSEGSRSPISRTGTPSMFTNNHLPSFNNGQQLYEEHYHQHSPSMAPLHIRHPSPGRSASPLNGHNLEAPHTYEQLIASNSALKTRVSELEVINELFKSRVSELEEQHAKRASSEQSLTQRLEESQRRENQLKHRLDDVEREFSELKGAEATNGDAEDGPPAKKMRLSDVVAEGGTLASAA